MVRMRTPHFYFTLYYAPHTVYRRYFLIFVFGATVPIRLGPHSQFLDHIQRRTTVGRTPLDEWSARRRDLYLTTHNIHRQTSMPPVGFEPTISAGERPQTYTLDRAATGTGIDITEYNLIGLRKMVTVSLPCQKFTRSSLLYYLC